MVFTPNILVLRVKNHAYSYSKQHSKFSLDVAFEHYQKIDSSRVWFYVLHFTKTDYFLRLTNPT